MSLKHFVTWEVTQKQLRAIATHLMETPIISIPIDETTEIIIKLKQVEQEDDIIKGVHIRFPTTDSDTGKWLSAEMTTP